MQSYLNVPEKIGYIIILLFKLRVSREIYVEITDAFFNLKGIVYKILGSRRNVFVLLPNINLIHSTLILKNFKTIALWLINSQ